MSDKGLVPGGEIAAPVENSEHIASLELATPALLPTVSEGQLAPNEAFVSTPSPENFSTAIGELEITTKPVINPKASHDATDPNAWDDTVERLSQQLS